jgi:hypothetical protein
MLPNQYSCFDCLTQADFVSQKVALDWISKHATNDRDLMLEQFDGRRRQAA